MTPPQGSLIRIEWERGCEKIIAPHGNGGVMRYFVALFLIAWLGGWAVGWVAALSSLVSGGAKGNINAFLLFWLVFWTVGGGFAIWWLFLILRPSVPESLLLAMPILAYDSGTPSFAPSSFNRKSQMEAWQRALKKRKRVDFSPDNIKTLRLRETDSGNRLTIDAGAERFELGSSLTEVEREWLFSILAQNYRLEQGRPK